MRKKKKKEIKNIIQTMLDAHKHIGVLLRKGYVVEAVDLLSQCQECAVQIGEAIEESEGNDTQIVADLEVYCELLYKLSKTNDKKRIKFLIHRIDDSLNRIKHRIDEEISTSKMKIVFMPYKASMWDCMESVWEAAHADGECEVCVVPIPYYERNDQGERERFCYEGNLFPQYVPVTYYEDYSLESEHPDIIYIHNPYDGANYVTSVYPEYYSSELKKYTDQLVYIPYYIIGDGDMPESHLKLPAYQYVDKIIVQDKEKAESLYEYVNEKKIAVIGSPKVDCLKKMNKKRHNIIDQEIPEEWKKKIDGKKVILFNVSVSGILQNSQYALDKIKGVLSEFDNQQNVVLLWRPHPLVEATLKSMRPDMYKEYMEIKRLFVYKDKGILDESANPDIAAVVADAYLGESSSSLVHYFGVLGKPILFINWKLVGKTQERKSLFCFYTFYQEKDSLYFVPSDRGLENCLYRLNLENGGIEKNMTLPGVSDERFGSYCGAKKVRNKLILIPFYAEDIYIYDIEFKHAYKVVLPNPQKDRMNFSEIVTYKDKVFFIPRFYPAIISLDIQNLKLREFKECIEFFYHKEKNNPLFMCAFLEKGEYLYLASCIDSRILIFNMEDGSYIVKDIGEYSYGYFHMVYDGEYFWLSAYESNHIVRWNEESREAKEFEFPVDKNQPTDRIISTLLDTKDEIIACCAFPSDIVFIDKNTGKCRREKRILREVKKQVYDLEEDAIIFARFIDEERAVLFNWGNKTVIIWNVYTNHICSIQCRLPKNEMLKLEKDIIEKYSIIKTTPYSLSENVVTISEFIDYIVLGEVDAFRQTYKCYEQDSDDMEIGTKIHKYIKNVDL